jgi:hypothetical protein
MTPRGPLAQLAEHLTFNQGVTGSNPVRPTIHVQSFILLNEFLQSRRQGSSIRTIEFYECCLKPFVLEHELTTDGINQFLRDRTCGNGKHGYYRALRALRALHRRESHGYNKGWEKFCERNPDATREEILRRGEKLRQR